MQAACSVFFSVSCPFICLSVSLPLEDNLQGDGVCVPSGPQLLEWDTDLWNSTGLGWARSELGVQRGSLLDLQLAIALLLASSRSSGARALAYLGHSEEEAPPLLQVLTAVRALTQSGDAELTLHGSWSRGGLPRRIPASATALALNPVPRTD